MIRIDISATSAKTSKKTNKNFYSALTYNSLRVCHCRNTHRCTNPGGCGALIGPCVLCTTKVLVWKTLERIAGMSAGKPMEIVQNFVGRVRVVD